MDMHLNADPRWCVHIALFHFIDSMQFLMDGLIIKRNQNYRFQPITAWILFFVVFRDLA